MSEATFSVTFDGPALDSHSMQVRDLAPALLALGEAVNSASRIMEPGAEPPGLAIKATGEGSFIIVLQVTDTSLLQRVQEMLTGDGVTAVVNLASLVSALAGGFLTVKWLMGRVIRSVDAETPRAGYVRITDERGDSIEVPSASWSAAQDLDFREAAREAVRPLRSSGVERMKIATAEDSVTIGEDEVLAFEVPEVAEQLILDAVSETVLRLVNVAFNEDHKWKVSEGDVSFWVQIEDLAFLERVSRGVESFSAGDLLRVRLRHQQWSTAAGPRSDRAVLEVLEHIPGPKQIALPFAED